MVELLRGLGRTNVLPQTVAQVGNLALGLRQQAEQEKTGALTRQATELQINKAQADLATAQAETTRANRPIPIDTLLNAFPTQEEGQVYLRAAQGQGIVNPEGFVRAGAASAFRETASKNSDLVLRGVMATRTVRNNQRVAVMNEVREYKEKNPGVDPQTDKKFGELLQRQQIANQQWEDAQIRVDTISESVSETLREKRGIAGVEEEAPFEASKGTDEMSIALFGRRFGELPAGSPEQNRVLKQQQKFKEDVIAAGKALPQIAQEKLISLYTVLAQVEDIEATFDDSYVGWFDAVTGSLKEFTGFNTDATEVIFRRTINDLGDSLLRLRSGAQISPDEFKRLWKLLPDYRLKEVAFKARLGGYKKELVRAVEIRKAVGGASGFNVPARPGAPISAVGLQGGPVTGTSELDAINAEIEELERKERGE